MEYRWHTSILSEAKTTNQVHTLTDYLVSTFDFEGQPMVSIPDRNTYIVADRLFDCFSVFTVRRWEQAAVRLSTFQIEELCCNIFQAEVTAVLNHTSII